MVLAVLVWSGVDAVRAAMLRRRIEQMKPYAEIMARDLARLPVVLYVPQEESAVYAAEDPEPSDEDA